MAAAPPNPAPAQERGTVVVFAVGAELAPTTREMLEYCRNHGAEPLVLDATQDPLFAAHLSDPRMLAHFPLLCIRGGLVGGIEAVRQLESLGQLRELLSSPDAPLPPQIALSKAAAEEFRRALVEPGQCIRIAITAEYEHDLSLDTEQPDDVRLVLGDVPLLLDAESATRAEGLAIDWVETPDGDHAFRMDNPNRPEPVHLIDRAWLAANADKLDFFVIDARTRAEYEAGHLSQARLLDATLIDELERLSHDTPLLFYCNGGVRSKKAAQRYLELGFAKVYCLSEGFGG